VKIALSIFEMQNGMKTISVTIQFRHQNPVILSGFREVGAQKTSGIDQKTVARRLQDWHYLKC
jgi:hypothetical protein